MIEEGGRGGAKAKFSKCIYTIQSLKNGRIAESEIFVARGRLSVQAQSKKFILQKHWRKHVGTEYIGTETRISLLITRANLVISKLIRVSVPTFWLRFCPTNFHKTIENYKCNFTLHKYKKNYLLGQHAFDGSLFIGDKHVS